MPVPTIRQMYGDSWKDMVQPTKDRLYAYNHSRIKCLGTIDIQCRSRNNTWHKERFNFVDMPGPDVLGLPSARKLKAITIQP